MPGPGWHEAAGDTLLVFVHTQRARQAYIDRAPNQVAESNIPL